MKIENIDVENAIKIFFPEKECERCFVKSKFKDLDLRGMYNYACKDWEACNDRREVKLNIVKVCNHCEELKKEEEMADLTACVNCANSYMELMMG